MSSTQRILFAALGGIVGVVASACSGEPAAVTAIPADVQAILDARCVECHTSPPRFGAPAGMGRRGSWIRSPTSW